MWLRRSVLSFLALISLHGCGPPVPPPGYEDVLLEGEASVETLIAFAAAFEERQVASGGLPLVITWPANGEKLHEEDGDVASFCWGYAQSAKAVFEGNVFYAVFSTEDDPALVRVLTTTFDYRPSAEVWEKMFETGKPITMRLVSAIVTGGRVAPGDGPFVGDEITITIVE
jgi:hypothetical protein